MAGDPSQNVHPDLLPHIHLISAYRYPLVPRFGISEVTDWLLNASRIARDGAPFFWTYLDVPQDGTILMTWQPLQRMGTEFATDGYIWPRGEVYYQHEIRDGLILEVYHQPVGYRPGEEYATHSRRRFRLMPPKVANPNIPQVDPSLWLVHYGPIDEREPMPVKKIRLEPRIRTLMEHRNNLQRAGQITRKEFMLSDRVNWPQIPLPRDSRGPPMYAGGPAGGHHVPQQMAYPPHVGGNLAPQPPSKRARHSAVGPGPGGAHPGGAHPGAGLVGGQHGMPGPPHGMMQPEMAIYEDEEDTSRGDLFDSITPRDVSLERYKQNHEWMEEVISSPYRIFQIEYADLGLGLKGELAPMTEGIFEGQGIDAFHQAPKKAYVGRLDSGLADEFRKRVAAHTEATNKEIAEMKARHEKLMADFRVNSVVKKAEHELRSAPGETGTEVWGLESRLDDGESSTDGSEGGRWAPQTPHKSVEAIAAQLETSLGRRIVASGLVTRIQDGGYQEPEPEPELEAEALLEVPAASGTGAGAGAGAAGGSPSGSQISGMIGDADMDMDGTAAGMLDQMDQMDSVFSPATSTPGNGFPPQQPLAPSGLSNVVTAGGPSPQHLVQAATGSAAVPAGAPPGGAGAPTGVADGAAGATSDDWVVVPAGGGVTPMGAGAGVSTASAAPAGAAVVAVAPVAAAGAAEATGAGMAATGAAGAIGGSRPASAVPTPGTNDFGSLADLDAGGGLDDGADLAEGLDMDMEDSAFGNAFAGED